MLEPHPSPRFALRFLDVLAILNGVIAPLALLPQVYAIWATGSAAGISVPTFALLACSSGVWVVYGLAHRAWPLVVSSSLFSLMYLVVIFTARAV